MADLTGFQIIEDSYTAEKYKKGLSFRYRIGIPENCPKDAALYIEHDYGNDNQFASALQAAKEGLAPYAICIDIASGSLAMKDGTFRQMRMNSYDLFDREYGNLLVYELIPHITDKYHLYISDDPDMHLIGGGSSGGVSAFCVAWYHSDYFHRVYMSSPSFLAMGRGNELPYLIRKCEPKHLRIYLERSENEPNEYFGSSFPMDLEAEMGLAFAGYDFKSVYFPGEGHVSRYSSYEDGLKRMAWLWNKRPIVAANNVRILSVIPDGSTWESYSGTFPVNKNTCHVSDVYSSCVNSSDKNMVYAADPDGTVIYSLVPEKDEQFVHAYLHTVPDVKPKVYGMDVDEGDRTYVLTDIGIQCIRSFGLIDVILDLPDKGTPEQLAFNGNLLYVKTSLGAYRRRMTHCGATEEKTERETAGYYD